MSLAARVKGAEAKILIIDIERLPGLARIWDQKTRFVPISQFTKLPSLLCFAAKWHGQSRVEFHAVWDDPAAMVQRAWELYDQADIVVTYNGRKFDNKHLKSEWLVYDLGPASPWKDVDLYQVNSREFGFESKSLSHLCHRLGLPGKSGHYDPVVAEQCIEGDAAAQRLMRHYNVGDVKITEQAYDRLLPWIHNHPHVRSLPASDGEAKLCNRCGSEDLERRGTYLATQITYTQFRCRNCGGWVRGGWHSRKANVAGVK